jgi:purine-binding chemotaxis protein CheW
VTHYVRLRIGEEAYAVPVGYVRGVATLGDVTPVPGGPPELLGVRNLRGQILPVVDLGRLLGTPRSAPAGRLLVTEQGARRAGLAIDEVSDVGELPEPAEEAGSPLLTGALLADGTLIGVIDVPRVLDSLEQQVSGRA